MFQGLRMIGNAEKHKQLHETLSVKIHIGQEQLKLKRLLQAFSMQSSSNLSVN